MKKIIASLLPVVALTFVASSAMAADMKLGVVDVRQVLQKSPQMAVVSGELKSQFKPREAKIIDAQKSLQAELDDLNKNGATMSAEDRSKLQDKIIAHKANVQGMVGSFQQDLANAQNQAMQKLLTKISDKITTIAKNSKLDLVLQRDSVPYANANLDITAQVVQAMLKD